MVLTRAFACALPVVASDIPGYREVLTPEASVAVPPGDAAALADAVCGARRRRAAAGALGIAARALAVERYSWPGIARGWKRIYAEVTGLAPAEARAA